MAWTEAFTLEHHVGRSPALIKNSNRGFGVQPWVGSNDGVKRSMVATEPERASGNNEKKFDRIKPNTSILKPEELMKEMKEANDFSEWQGHHIPSEEMHHNGNKSKKEALVDIDAMVQEVEDVLDADDDSSKAELIIDEVENIAEASVDEKPEEESDSSSTPAAVAAIEASKKAEDRFKNKQQLAKHNVFFRVLNRVLSPIFGRAIEKNVPKNTIKGAWLSGAFISLVGGLDPVTALFTATGLSYVSITPGVSGDIVRAAGEATWDSGLIALKVAKNISAALGVDTTRIYSVGTAVVEQEKETDVGDDIKKLVREVEETVAEVDSVLQSTTDTRDAWEAEETAVRLAEEARLAEIEYLLEEARIEKESQEFEAEFLAEEARIAEDERLAEIARLEEDTKAEEESRLAECARLAEEERVVEEAKLAEEERLAEYARLAEEAKLAEEERVAEEAKLAEEERITEESRIAEEERLAEEAKLAEEERLAEEARLAEETKLAEEEEDLIDDDDWEASIQLAEGLSTDLTGVKGNWDAARQLAKDLVDEPEDDPINFNAPGLSDEERMELIGQAARAAVEKFEAAKQQDEDLEFEEKSKRNEMKSILQKEGINGLQPEPQARPQPVSPPAEEQNYKTMTVVMLKEVLRGKGLKMSGKKAQLIERLLADDA